MATTVTGRVRATVRLKNGDGGDAQVVTLSWASDRMFPRTRGAGVAFELQTGDGVVLRVEPFEALVTLLVRRRAQHDGVWNEAAWIALEDELTVEGELVGAGPVPTMNARRIVLDGHGATVRMWLPPGALERGEAEELASAISAIEAPPETPAEPANVEAAPEPADAASEPAVARRPKKKRPDSSGTPTPIQ